MVEIHHEIEIYTVNRKKVDQLIKLCSDFQSKIINLHSKNVLKYEFLHHRRGEGATSR
jgi:hypothetical protein